ncbi:uncharacterized protein M421DRAFT_375238 [Didymella exigua CBS 183.55]|uniref:Uncharacterized protein n=1 Tax=Didymella exigua CBS 183.55 TaxID=1150837 RepID=A0A6A5RTK1_9PLEO|nr:uncharacterized protein M421DRAFT_375238 [Didymella exigua CBS 183.55]KAF1930484.1 hypothetical protein M421DRAFT_375238 [Didymella exigua CBS 183.55]
MDLDGLPVSRLNFGCVCVTGFRGPASRYFTTFLTTSSCFIGVVRSKWTTDCVNDDVPPGNAFKIYFETADFAAPPCLRHVYASSRRLSLAQLTLYD